MSCNQCDKNNVAVNKKSASFIGTIIYSAVMIAVLAIIGYEVFCVIKVKMFVSAAEKGDAEAMYYAGEYYAQGKGVARKTAIANYYFKKAAEAGFVPPAENVERYKKSAEKDHVDMMFIYSIFVRYGWGVEKDIAAAAEWLRKSADKGSADAQVEYALCCMKGIGRTVDIELAKTYLEKAVAQDNEEAEKLYDEIKEVSNIDDIDKKKIQ